MNALPQARKGARAWRRPLLGLAAALACLAPAAARAEEDLANDTCFTCHADADAAPLVSSNRFAGSMHADLQCTACHVDVKEIPHTEKLAKVNCAECHQLESEVYLESDHGKALVRGTDVAASCRDCHGSAHEILSTHNPLSPVFPTNLVVTCANCHGDVEKMRRFNLSQSAPIASYKASVHGLARETSGNPLAASCADCHGSHDLHHASNPASKLNWQNIPKTCGKCHENILNTFERSIHGQAVARGIHDAPVCTTCHGEHTVAAIKNVESKVYPSHITETCGQCHAAERIVSKYNMAPHTVESYMSSFHGLSLQLGSVTAANCASCHGAHDILPSSDPRSSVSKVNLAQTCGRCHPGVSEQVARGQIHSGTRPGLEHRAVGWVRHIYIGLFIVVLGGMFLHNLLDFLRKLRAHYRRSETGAGALRMHGLERVQHVVLLTSFIVLAYTGFALKFPNAWWARPFVGDVDWRGITHRVAAVFFVALSLYHFAYMLFTNRGRVLLGKLRFRGIDFVQPFQMFAYYLGLRREKPALAEFCYIEKAEYWALVWGGVVMTLTGAFMTWADWSLRFFPVWLFDVITAIHYYEAILACAAIVLWHFYFVIFDPDEYPLKWTWFTGKESDADHEHRHGGDKH